MVPKWTHYRKSSVKTLSKFPVNYSIYPDTQANLIILHYIILNHNLFIFVNEVSNITLR